MPESLRLFSLCQAMEWAVLPNAGGLYDQHPQLIREWMIIFNIKGEYEKEKQAQRDAEMRSSSRRR